MNGMVEDDTSEQPAWHHGLRRVLLLVAILAALWGLGVATGLHEHISAENIRAVIGQAGIFGVALFVLAFVVGQVTQISGHAFIAASVLVWGWWQGALISILAATVGAIFSFWFSRTVGGDVRGVKRPLLQRVLASLDRAPFRTIVVARLIFMTAPPLAPAFAVSGVRDRDHALGSFVGLVPSVFLSAFGWGFGLQWLGLTP